MRVELGDVSRHVAVLVQVLHRLDAALARDPQPSAAPRPATLIALDEHPATSRFLHLARAFDLSQVELDLLLLALAPELDRRYGGAFAQLQDDRTCRRPTVGLALDLLGLTAAQRLAALHLLGPRAPLVRHGLLQLDAGPGDPLPERQLVVDDRMVGFVTGDDTLDPALAGLVEVVRPRVGPDQLVLADAVRGRLAALFGAAPRGLVCHLRGPRGSGRQAVAEALALAWGDPALLRVDTAGLPLDDPIRFAAVLRLVGREARLRGAATAWERFDVLLAERRDPLRTLVIDELSGPLHAIVSSEGEWSGPDRPPVADVELRLPGAAERANLWRRALPGAEAVAAVAAPFRLGHGAIAAAAAQAGTPVTAAELAAACRRQSTGIVAGEMMRLDTPFGWDDLVLPADRMQRLRALCDRVWHRGLVHDDWGFAATVGPAGGIPVLFTGPPGTGKTMAAGVLARALGLPLHRVDLAGVVSKYIGETEKNLARVFAAAESANVVLFFDEADALFGKRTGVRDAHDRYANLEVSYLLQRIEAYDGVVVLATNLRKNVDEAFLRRLQFVVEFPMPDREHRLRIWRQVWPAAAPLHPTLDLDMLAERFELSGGSIRNVALEAAFAAAATGSAIGSDQVLAALRHEHQKLGRVVSDGILSETRNGRAALARSTG